MVSTAAKEKEAAQQEHSVFPETVNRGFQYENLMRGYRKELLVPMSSKN